ncbi:MAG: nucleoside 2-deoxyribosyltransferase domain-containing protein [Nanoarchaeota archaeon]|nr:nucleoside 2-deoxyribosyltransferase domain-containing protein [Nanoarchaeota archaeon]
MTNAIYAPNYLENIDSPVIFLAGPIQGVHPWQEEAIKLIQALDPKITIANPRRNIEKKGDFTTDMYNEQVDWETFHLRKAGENGCVLFWLAKESSHDCSRAYAQTSRFEIAEWKMRHEFNKANIVIGIEDGFTGAKYIRRRFMQDCPEVPICNSLEETCEQAVRLAYVRH